MSEETGLEGTGFEEPGTGGERAGEAPSESPADAARRALRAARAVRGAADDASPPDAVADAGTPPAEERDSGAAKGAFGGPREAGGTREGRTGRELRPGDAARAALRRAAAARRGAGESATEETGETGAGPGEDPDDTSAGAERARDTRPADLARDALRTARRQRERERAAQAREGSSTPRTTPRRPAPPASSRGTEATREVAAFLANAFRMPPDTDGPDEAAPLGGTSGPGETSGPVHQEARDPATGPVDGPSRTPAAMGSPHRDSDLRRTFPALAPQPPAGDGRFAETWWGNAWITALEEGALDVKRLARGRGYAEQGHVDAITVTPGQVLAYVHGSRPRPYRVQIRLRTLDDPDWERFLDAAAERPGHIAALLDKEMPHALAEGDVRLLPGPGDLEPRCSCPDRGHPCKHAAALCYQTARLLDADPFVLLLLRGRGERELLDALSRLSATRAARAAQERDPAPLPGVRATDALAPRRLPPLPAPLRTPAHPEQPPAYPAAPGGPDPLALDQLATDAAARAHALLATGHDPVAGLTLWEDAVRLAAARPGAGLTAATRGLYASLASAAGRTPAELARAVAAWRQGGPDGLAALEQPWDPPAGRFDRARPLLLAADFPPFRPSRNRLTHPRGHLQLRLGRDGLWYAYESDPGADDWWPRGTPDLDPVGALTGLGGAADA
ncbi:SWIM zinc finger family protein [Streptomyces sp.]|uniref:SWIM zinc finger family protein n=1 Tax=Streptomyces sp. TaxID=1931 RepID=UPI002D5E94AF|nr:SWIM zinc finger family protein [Streptomyces sp.]HZF89872.1 SWIM zinc finger family protein [Streptomyces sp.]